VLVPPLALAGASSGAGADASFGARAGASSAAGAASSSARWCCLLVLLVPPLPLPGAASSSAAGAGASSGLWRWCCSITKVGSKVLMVTMKDLGLRES
jgi:hypothetical protein